MRGRCLLWLPTAQVLGLYAYGLFVVMYFVYGGLLLPLEIWAPAVEAGQPYKIQGKRRVPKERIVPVVVHAVGHLVTIALPFILWIAHVIACVWFAIGNANDASWVTRLGKTEKNKEKTKTNKQTKSKPGWT